MRNLRAAVSFLTRLPVETAASEPGAGSVPWFPVVGGLLGLTVAGIFAAALLALPPLVAATVATGCGVFLTGALHEDGLADAADALGGWSEEEARRILKDPTLGTYGVLAIVLSLLLRVGALAALDPWTAVATLVGAHALSRAASIGLLGTARTTTEMGLAASYRGTLSRRQALGGVVAGLLIGSVSLGPWALPAAVLAGIGAWVVGRLSIRKFGGITGDVLGAAQQLGEVAVLLLGAAAAATGLPSPAWWR